MLEVIESLEVCYVVDLDVVSPDVPVVADTEEEAVYANAINWAIAWGAITTPGRYGIAERDGQLDIFLLISEFCPN